MRLVAAIVISLLRALVRDPVFDLVRSVDRMSIRSLLLRFRNALQPDATWTINWIGGAPTPFADVRVNPHQRQYPLGSKPLSRAPAVAESPTPRISAQHDETRAIDQRGAAGNTRRDSGGRRVR
jgi:hypothetical protein